MMELIGSVVGHPVWGLGIIEAFSNGLITVRFFHDEEEDKIARFAFPNAFVKGFLSAVSDDLLMYIEELKDKQRCAICGKENVQTVVIDGKRACADCKRAKATKCVSCGKSCIRDDESMVTEYDAIHIKRPLCQDCVAQKSFRCVKCWHRYFLDHQSCSSGEGHGWCKQCEKAEWKPNRTPHLLSLELSRGDTLYGLLIGNDECYQHLSVPAEITIQLKMGSTITTEGRYCLECNQAQVSRNTYASLSRYHDVMLCDHILKGLSEIESEPMQQWTDFEFHERAEESKLRKYGYSVARTDPRSAADRQGLLHHLIVSEIVTKEYVVRHLEHMISINGRKKENSDAVEKWRADLDFVLRVQI